ncbi:hypothetical protein PUY80_00375 [Plantibacter flavus]|uniref:hypothetical protein n=1 Tax=Plantibacter flavus TaxID=150123 RepID=UPI0023780320|nr:hypothetical protein [Plantibacter flavus]MDD9151015.1 hypothetical protein [Plantibacter flavus]
MMMGSGPHLLGGTGTVLFGHGESHHTRRIEPVSLRGAPPVEVQSATARPPVRRSARVPRLAAVVCAVALALTACARPIDTDDSDSIALVEAFFAHLEAGEATEAAALTSIDFPEEFIDDDFYRASDALPSDARIVKTTGYDAGGFTATVEYTLEGAEGTGRLELRVVPEEGELRIASWRGDGPITISRMESVGTVTVNDQLKYVLAEDGNELQLLPGAYAVAFEDPTGLVKLIGKEDAFTAYVPDLVDADGQATGDGFSFSPAFMSDVEPGLAAAIEGLQAACGAEHFVGPSCPEELTSVLPGPLGDAVTAEWFREPGPEIVLIDGEYHATSAFRIRFSDDALPILTVSYTGVLTRDAAGTIAFTR